MKTFYLILIFLAAGVCLHAQTEVMPSPASVNNIEKSNAMARSSAADDSTFNHIHILPNLAVGKITLVVDDANANVIQQGECVIYNSGGLPVAKSPFTTGTNQIYITILPAGMYYVKLMQKNGEVATRKFLVMR
jgi:hypothetical protein